MTSTEKIHSADPAGLKILKYPHPLLAEVCTPVEEHQDSALASLARRMMELMAQAKGVGLAAPQVGVTVRMFIANPTGQEADFRVYVNPKIVAAEDPVEGEEGCLSFPGIYCKIKRFNVATIEATDLAGQVFRQEGRDILARVFQHELDHLDGRLLTDRMGALAKLAHRRSLKELQLQYSGELS
ncbi:MAG: peptide deformylase [Planctomycetes bacterium]|nr:peptide deformylase [Planctomycetota bacterium]